MTIDFRSLIDTNEVYKHKDTRIEYALLQKPYISPRIEYKDTCVYMAAAISEDGEEVMLEWHNNPYASLGKDEATDWCSFDENDFRVI